MKDGNGQELWDATARPDPPTLLGKPLKLSDLPAISNLKFGGMEYYQTYSIRDRYSGKVLASGLSYKQAVRLLDELSG